MSWVMKNWKPLTVVGGLLGISWLAGKRFDEAEAFEADGIREGRYGSILNFEFNEGNISWEDDVLPLVEEYTNDWNAQGIGFGEVSVSVQSPRKVVLEKLKADLDNELGGYIYYDAESFEAETFNTESKMECPPATKDVAINTKNRNATIKNFGYGPLNVEEPGDFWKDIAKQWKTTEKAAKKSKCGNCVAFDRSPRMKDCMPGETSDGEGVLGYCWMHHFKCHSARTCDTWAKGGPITTDKVSEGWQERAFAKSEKKEAESFEAQSRKTGEICGVKGCKGNLLETEYGGSLSKLHCDKCNYSEFMEWDAEEFGAETFESEWVVEAVQQNLNDKDFVNYAYKILIGGDAKTFEEKSMAIAETMNQNANNDDFTSFVESELFNAETFDADFNDPEVDEGDFYIRNGRKYPYSVKKGMEWGVPNTRKNKAWNWEMLDSLKVGDEIDLIVKRYKKASPGFGRQEGMRTTTVKEVVDGLPSTHRKEVAYMLNPYYRESWKTVETLSKHLKKIIIFDNGETILLLDRPSNPNPHAGYYHFYFKKSGLRFGGQHDWDNENEYRRGFIVGKLKKSNNRAETFEADSDSKKVKNTYRLGDREVKEYVDGSLEVVMDAESVPFKSFWLVAKKGSKSFPAGQVGELRVYENGERTIMLDNNLIIPFYTQATAYAYLNEHFMVYPKKGQADMSLVMSAEGDHDHDHEHDHDDHDHEDIDELIEKIDKLTDFAITFIHDGGFGGEPKGVIVDEELGLKTEIVKYVEGSMDLRMIRDLETNELVSVRFALSGDPDSTPILYLPLPERIATVPEEERAIKES